LERSNENLNLERIMNRIKNSLLVVLVASAFTLTATAQADSTQVVENVEPAEINWMSFEEAFELNKTAPKKWMVDVSTSWCGWCKKMDASTFVDPIITDYLNENYYAIRLDGEEKEDIVLDGATFKFVASGRRGYNELPAKLMGGKMSYPTIVFLSPEVQVYQSIPGYKSKEDLLPILQFINEFEANPSLTWEQFNEAFTSPYVAE
jgi:thioredoxin-related protein